VTPSTDRRAAGAEDPRIHRSWLIFAGAFFALGLLSVIRLVANGVRPLDAAMTGLLVVVGFAAIRHRLAVQELEAGRRSEAESFARILQGLSRSISADAIVGAIIEELGSGTGADHVVIVRRRPDARVLEATLVNARTGGSTSSTLFPISDLEDPPDEAGIEREPIAVPVGPDHREVLAFGAATTAGVPVLGPASDRAVPLSHRSGRRSPEAAPAPALEPAGDDPSPAAALLVAERIGRRARSIFGLRNTLAAPLTAEGRQIGALVISRRTAAAWPPSAQRILTGAAVEASAALSRAYTYREAEARASTDALTGLPNRRYFDEFCALLARRRRAEDSVGVLMVDIDRFKALNDSHGHQVGDEVLRAVAGAIAGAVREDDVPARYGGEEFAVLLRNPTIEVAVDVGERVREAVGGLDLSRFGVAGVSVSVGAAVAEDPDEPIAQVVAQADRALYQAKRRGRDQVVA